MNFPNPKWLAAVPKAGRQQTLEGFKTRLVRLYASADGEASNARINQATRIIETTEITDKGPPLPQYVLRGDDSIRTRFLYRLAALYATPSGSLKALSRACGLSETTISVMVRRKGIPPLTAKAISKLTGSDILPLALLCPRVFGDD